MKFQFSISRLLMATAMVGLIFGLARLALDEEISNYAIFIAVLALDWGLIVLVARHRCDFYRVLRIIAVAICVPAILVSLILLTDSYSPSRSWGFGLLAIGVAMIFLFIILNRLIGKAEKEEAMNELKKAIELDP